MVWWSRLLQSWKQSADLAYICLQMKKRYNLQVNGYSRAVSAFFCSTSPWICKCSLWVMEHKIRNGRCEAISWMTIHHDWTPQAQITQVHHTHVTPLLRISASLFCLYKLVISILFFLALLTMVHVIYYWYKYLCFISQNGMSYVVYWFAQNGPLNY
jgi:hypothetical protein